MHIWAIGDLHLSFGVENKSMDVFGPQWENHAETIEREWKATVRPEDIVLIPGDISWAMRLEEAVTDLRWIDALPGTKVMIKGNHDYWWSSLKKLAEALPPSIHVIQNNAFEWKDVSIGGARLWDTPEYSFHEYIEFQENPTKTTQNATPSAEDLVQEELSQKIFDRELERLKLSLKAMNPHSKFRIAMTHYPPIGPKMEGSRAAQILEQNGVQVCVFGHLHNIRPNISLFGERNGVRYILSSSDYIRFKPVAVL